MHNVWLQNQLELEISRDIWKVVQTVLCIAHKQTERNRIGAFASGQVIFYMEGPEGRTQSIPHKWNKQLSKARRGTTRVAGQITLRPKHHNECANTTPLTMTSNAHTSANSPWPTCLHREIFIRILKYITILWYRTETWRVEATRSAPVTTCRARKLKYMSITTVSVTHMHLERQKESKSLTTISKKWKKGKKHHLCDDFCSKEKHSTEILITAKIHWPIWLRWEMEWNSFQKSKYGRVNKGRRKGLEILNKKECHFPFSLHY